MITVKENADEWLQYVDPSLNALIAYLSRLNDGIPVREHSSFTDEHGRKILVMSNGCSYTKNAQSKWAFVQ